MRRIKRTKRDFEIKLEQEFPFMRQKEVTGEQWEKGGYSTYDAYGLECSEGWYNVLRGLCLDITKAYEKANMPVDIVVTQIKEKFGTLRFYCYPEGHDPGIFAFDTIGGGSLRKIPGESDLHREVAEIVRKWEDESANVCEACGSTAEIRTDIGWIRTLCDSCYAECKRVREERERQRKEREQNPELLEAERRAEQDEKHRQTLTVEDVAGMTGDEQLYIPERVKYIDKEVFDAYTRLKHIQVDMSNTVFKSVDGVLFKEEQFYGENRSYFVRYPAEKAQDFTGYNIPEGVHAISEDAFKGCSKLTSITVPKTVEKIAWGAFGDSGVKNILVDPENRDFTSIDGVLFSKYETELYAYPPGKDLESYAVSSEVTKIWHDAFRNARNLAMLFLSDSVGFIGNRAFEGLASLKTILLPKAFLNDNCRVFYNCPCLEIIEVTAAKEVFFAGNHLNSIDGVLFKGPITYSRYTKDGEEDEWVVHTLMRYPEAKAGDSYVIPQGITTVLEYAFADQIHLRSITIPDSVTEIGEGAFDGCHEGLSLRCYENTYAHEYAGINEISYELIPPEN